MEYLGRSEPRNATAGIIPHNRFIAGWEVVEGERPSLSEDMKDRDRQTEDQEAERHRE